MAPLHPKAIKKKTQKNPKCQTKFWMPTTLKKSRFLKLGVKKAKLATLTSYRPDFQKLANKVEIHSRSNASKISEKCNVVFVFIL